jgi:hypothetical protein
MTPLDAATLLNRREYGSEVTNAEDRMFRDAGLVVVFGASDDLIEFRGAINDELGAYGGADVRLTERGLLVECDCNCQHYKRAKEQSVKLRAIWDDGSGWSWKYQAPFEHVQFDILEDGEPYCRGIVFRLASVDTHPKDGDVEQAPLVSGAVGAAETPNPSPSHTEGGER